MRKIKIGDTVKVMRGKDAGKIGRVVRVINKKNTGSVKVIVENVNKVKKSTKPNPNLGITGGIVEFEKPIDISNVMVIDPSLGIPTRVGFKFDENTKKKYRISKKTGQKL